MYISLLYIPVDGDVICDMVYNFNNNLITLPCNNWRTRELAIDSNHVLCLAQVCHLFQPYLRYDIMLYKLKTAENDKCNPKMYKKSDI